MDERDQQVLPEVVTLELVDKSGPPPARNGTAAEEAPDRPAAGGAQAAPPAVRA